MKTVEQFMKKLLSFVSVDQAADEVMITCFDICSLCLTVVLNIMFNKAAAHGRMLAIRGIIVLRRGPISRQKCSVDFSYRDYLVFFYSMY